MVKETWVLNQDKLSTLFDAQIVWSTTIGHQVVRTGCESICLTNGVPIANGSVSNRSSKNEE